MWLFKEWLKPRVPWHTKYIDISSWLALHCSVAGLATRTGSGQWGVQIWISKTVVVPQKSCHARFASRLDQRPTFLSIVSFLCACDFNSYFDTGYPAHFRIRKRLNPDTHQVFKMALYLELNITDERQFSPQF